MHGSQGRNALGIQRFLPWHRVYLLRLEGLGKAIDPQFFIPYWDWTTERQVPRWIASFTPTVRTSDRSIVVRRNSGRIPMLRADRGTVNRVLRNRTYTEFTRALEEGPHDYVHGWVGGPMGTIPTAPADPLFWMHHAQVDRLWSQWQVSHPGVLANLTGRNAVMDPWADTAASVNSISALNYRYGP
jgi:tyrosinase